MGRGGKENEKVGEHRLASYLAKNHQETYIEVGKDYGLCLTRPMDKIESAAMWRDARLLDGQARIVVKHLRFHYTSTVAVPLERTYSLVEGYTKPRVKVLSTM